MIAGVKASTEKEAIKRADNFVKSFPMEDFTLLRIGDKKDENGNITEKGDRFVLVNGEDNSNETQLKYYRKVK